MAGFIVTDALGRVWYETDTAAKAKAAAVNNPLTGPHTFGGPAVKAATLRVYEHLGDREALPFMARVRDFTREEVLAGKLREADEEAERQNLAYAREIALVALGLADA